MKFRNLDYEKSDHPHHEEAYNTQKGPDGIKQPVPQHVMAVEREKYEDPSNRKYDSNELDSKKKWPEHEGGFEHEAYRKTEHNPSAGSDKIQEKHGDQKKETDRRYDNVGKNNSQVAPSTDDRTRHQ